MSDRWDSFHIKRLFEDEPDEGFVLTTKQVDKSVQDNEGVKLPIEAGPSIRIIPKNIGSVLNNPASSPSIPSYNGKGSNDMGNSNRPQKKPDISSGPTQELPPQPQEAQGAPEPQGPALLDISQFSEDDLRNALLQKLQTQPPPQPQAPSSCPNPQLQLGAPIPPQSYNTVGPTTTSQLHGTGNLPAAPPFQAQPIQQNLGNYNPQWQGQPSQNFGPSQLNYAPQPQNIGLANLNYGQAPQNYGNTPQNLGQSMQNYSQPPMSYAHAQYLYNAQMGQIQYGIPPQPKKESKKGKKPKEKSTSPKADDEASSKSKQKKVKKPPTRKPSESESAEEESNSEDEVPQKAKGSSKVNSKSSKKNPKTKPKKKPATPEESSQSASDSERSQNKNSSEDDDNMPITKPMKRRTSKASGGSSRPQKSSSKPVSIITDFRQLGNLGRVTPLNCTTEEYKIIKEYFENSFSHFKSKYHLTIHSIMTFGKISKASKALNSSAYVPPPSKTHWPTQYTSQPQQTQLGYSASAPPVPTTKYLQKFGMSPFPPQTSRIKSIPSTRPCEILLWSKTSPGAVAAIEQGKDGCAAFYDRCVRALAVELPDVRKKPFRQILLLSSVSVGKTERSKRGFHHWLKNGAGKLRPDCDTVKSMGRYAPDYENNRELTTTHGNGSVIVPCGKTVKIEALSKSSLHYNEYIVFEGSRTKVMYAVDVEISPK